MPCNIDARGKAVRLTSGIAVTLLGAVLLLLLVLGSLTGGGWWALTLLILAIGLFGVYEGWSGWCVLRAMGLRTWV